MRVRDLVGKVVRDREHAHARRELVNAVVGVVWHRNLRPHRRRHAVGPGCEVRNPEVVPVWLNGKVVVGKVARPHGAVFLAL